VPFLLLAHVGHWHKKFFRKYCREGDTRRFAARYDIEGFMNFYTQDEYLDSSERYGS
jgi:hypothetical protein